MQCDMRRSRKLASGISLTLVIWSLTPSITHGWTYLLEHMRRGGQCWDTFEVFLIGSNEIARPIAKETVCSRAWEINRPAYHSKRVSNHPRVGGGPVPGCYCFWSTSLPGHPAEGTARGGRGIVNANITQGCKRIGRDEARLCETVWVGTLSSRDTHSAHPPAPVAGAYKGHGRTY